MLKLLLCCRFGRRPIFFASLVIQVGGGLLASVAPEFITFMLARMLIGSTTSGVFLVAYVIGEEFCFYHCKAILIKDKVCIHHF